MSRKSVAATAAAVFAIASLATSAHAGKVKCVGANSCKGTSACKTASSSCKGQNSCKGQGVTQAVDAAACTAKGGRPLHWLDRIRRDYPMVLHGVSLSIGSIDPLDQRYLDALAALVDRVQPAWVSDHLCFTGLRGINLHDLLPLPYTEEALNHVCERVLAVQDRLKRRLVLENVSSYVTYAASELSEWEFIAELARRADCDILLDVNNVYVSAFNHEFDAATFLRAMPRERVRQFHLAGHTHNGSHIVDTHDRPIVADVWALYREAVRLFPGVPTMIERDADIPPYAELLSELDVAREIAGALPHGLAA